MTATTQLARVRNYLVLPAAISPFEHRHLRRINRIALVVFWCHVPVIAAIAAVVHTSVLASLIPTSIVLVPPTLAVFALARRPRATSAVLAVTAMSMGGVLTQIGQGPLQIEMHFYVFIMLALLAVFANPGVILVAAATLIAHHVLTFLWIPAASFHDAATVTLGFRVLFVLFATVVSCFVARQFFDNVFGLEAVASARTEALACRSLDMAHVLANVEQGVVAVDLAGRMRAESSAALSRWFGPVTVGASIAGYLAGNDPRLAATLERGFARIGDRCLPLVLDHLPRQLARDGRVFALDYRGIDAPPTGVLVVITADCAGTFTT